MTGLCLGRWARRGGREEEFSTERADPRLVIGAHPALCLWPLLRRPSCQAAAGGEGPAALLCLQLSEGFWFSSSLLLGFCFVSFRFVFFWFGLFIFKRG